MTVEKETTREDWDRLRKQYPAIDPKESNVAEGVFQGTDEELELVKRQEMERLRNQQEDNRLASTTTNVCKEVQEEKQLELDLFSPTPPKPINTTGITGIPEDNTFYGLQKSQWKVEEVDEQPIDTQDNSKPLYLHELSEEAREKLSKKGACVALDDLPKEDQEKLKSGRPISFPNKLSLDDLSEEAQHEFLQAMSKHFFGHELKEAREDIKGMTPDMVNHPSHYTYGKIECIDAIEESMTTEAFRGYCKGAALKYLWRYERKGKPLEDLQKAQWYLVKLISSHQ